MKKGKKTLLVADSIPETLGMQLGPLGQDLKDSLVKDFIGEIPGDIGEQVLSVKRKAKREIKPNLNQTGEMALPSPELLSPDREVLLFSAEKHQNEQEQAERHKADKNKEQLLVAELRKVETEKEMLVEQAKEMLETIDITSEAAGIDSKFSLLQIPKKIIGKYIFGFFGRILSELRHKAENAIEWAKTGEVRAKGKPPRGLEYFWRKDANKQGVTEHGTMMIQG